MSAPQLAMGTSVTGTAVLAGQRFDRAPGTFADIDTAAVRLLSVREIQDALRNLRTRRADGTAADAVPLHADSRESDRRTSAVGVAPPIGNDACELSREWVVVIAAHPGAGASTVALAVSDAASVAGRDVHLVETAPMSRSGLVAAAASELGTDATGQWRRGVRNRVVVDRRAGERNPAGWPAVPHRDADAWTVIDLGHAARASVPRLSAAGCRTVIVCRLTVPGTRAAEQLLGQLSTLPIAVAALGGRGWPGEVTGSLGPRLRALRASGRVVRVPIDRRLQVIGLTHLALPKPVLAAGRSLLALLEDNHPGTDAQTRPATREGSNR